MDGKELGRDAFDKLPPGYEDSSANTLESKANEQKQLKEPNNLLSGNMAAIFVNSAVTGSAIISLPFALKQSGNHFRIIFYLLLYNETAL